MKTFRLFEMLAYCLMALSLVACGKAGTDSGAVTDTKPALPGAPGNGITAPTPTPVPAVTNINSVYYKLSFTEAPIGGWPTKAYTATGYCTSYKSKTYCWDDGLKSVVIPGVGTYYYTYWAMGILNNSWGPCYGGCVQDLLPAPTFGSPALVANITNAKITNMFNTGAPKAVVCTEANGLLDCVDFVINLNQIAL